MQQINLYQPIFRGQEKVFSAKVMLQASLVVIAALVALQGFAYWQNQSLRAQLTTIEQQRAETAPRIEELARTLPPQTADPALEQEVAKLRRLIGTKEQVTRQLASQYKGNREGFVGQLAGLARQKLPLLWLRQVALRRSGTFLELRGSTLKPEQVPQYLQRLAHEPAFSGMEFEHFEMSRPEDDPRRVDFHLLTEKDKDEAAQ